jgi:Domain of unknown function (DUF4157)
MIKQAASVPIASRTSGPALQRKCACGTHTIGGGACGSCSKQGSLTVGASDGEQEREAERVAGQVMRMRSSGRVTPSSVSAQRFASSAGRTPQVDGDTEGRIRRAAGAGEPLAEPARGFFEPRFGRDFSTVRVHRGPDAASLAQGLDAEAFTVGRNIFFNAQRYNPSSAAGMHLLAHELTHVAQQNAGGAEVVQRAKIAYTTLSWSDFKATPDAKSKRLASTISGFTVPNWSSTKSVTATTTDCKRGKKSDKEHEATVFVDPTIYDAVAPLMDQDTSWVKEQLKDGPSYCGKTKAKECQTHFAGKNAGTFSLLDDKKQPYATAKKADDCTDKSFQDPCLARAAALSTALLPHEQGHFDISKVIADKTIPDMKAKAATFTATATGCGRTRAVNAAQTKFNAMKAGTALDQRAKDWIDLRQKASDDYDLPTETAHGDDPIKQAAWVADIKAKLPKYDLNPAPPAVPATPAPSGSGTPTPPPAAPPTGSAAPGTPAPKTQSNLGGTAPSFQVGLQGQFNLDTKP